MNRYRIRIKDTRATIICEERHIDLGYREIIRHRKTLEDYLDQHPEFGDSLVPVTVPETAPEMIRHMARAAAIFGSGPMSAVAGAIAQYTVRAMLEAGADHVVMDNGGDIAMKINRPVTVGIFSGPSRIREIGLRFTPTASVIGICTSSGTVGHSLSFGCADAATVIARDVLMADAAATVLGNDIKTGEESDVRDVLNRHLSEGIEALIVIVGDVVAFGGKMPEMVRSACPLERISC